MTNVRKLHNYFGTLNIVLFFVLVVPTTVLLVLRGTWWAPLLLIPLGMLTMRNERVKQLRRDEERRAKQAVRDVVATIASRSDRLPTITEEELRTLLRAAGSL